MQNRSAKERRLPLTITPDLIGVEDDKPIQVGGKGMAFPKVYKAFDDSSIPSKEYFEELDRVAKKQIIWGGTTFLNT